jgi:hypothetical protein
MNRWHNAVQRCVLMAALLALFAWPKVSHAISFSDADIHNAARRMTSLTEQIHETRMRLEGAPFFETDLKVFAAVLQARGDIVPELPIALDVGVESMSLTRGYTEVSIQISDEKRSWTAAFTAAGLAYGLNREYDVDTGSFTSDRPNFDDAGPRSGGDAHGDQFMDAAYLIHGKAGEFRYELGYLQTSVIQPEVGVMVLDSERETTGRWATTTLDWRDIKVGLRADVEGAAGIDFFTFDWNLLSSLNKFNIGDGKLGSPKLPQVKLLLEYTKFAQLADELVGGGAGTVIGYAADRGDDFLMGFNLKQDFVALWRDGPPSDILNSGGFEDLWIDAEGHYGLTSGVFRDAMVRAGTTLWFPPTKKGHLVAVQLHGGYSTFTDEAALPVLLEDKDKTSVAGTLIRVSSKARFKNKKTGKFFPPVFHLIGEFRSNWAPDLARVVEFANTPIIHVGLAMTYGL